MEINKPQDIDFSEVNSIGIALSRPYGNHIAILFQDSSGKSMLLHVGEHKGELITTPTNEYIWLNILKDLSPLRRPSVIATIQHIAEVNADTDVRYGFDHGLYCLDAETGQFNSNYDVTRGFTCATFVLEVFLSCGIKLIDWDSWPALNEEDKKFRDFIFYKYLKNPTHVSPEKATNVYLDAQEKKLNAPRFLPEEIAAATDTIIESKHKDIRGVADYINDALIEYKEELRTQSS